MIWILALPVAFLGVSVLLGCAIGRGMSWSDRRAAEAAPGDLWSDGIVEAKKTA